MEASINLRRSAAKILLIYFALTIGFYFLAGRELRFRNSRGNIAMPAAEAGTVELAQGAVVEQRFTAQIQLLESVSVQWGTYYRPNNGTVTMELLREDTGEQIINEAFDAAAIEENGKTTAYTVEPQEGLFGVPLLLRLYADSPRGEAVSPMMSTSTRMEGFALYFNGIETDGTLCFSVSGEDYIWTGLHYWTFMLIGFILLLLFLALVWYRWWQGHSYVVNALIAVKKYRFLIRQLVARDFKTKYKRSVLGVFWSFLNPLLTMAVQYIVFSTIFKSDIPNYPAYLLVGIVSFNFFSEACGMALSSVTGNAALITKVYVPKYIYPLTRVMSSLVNLAISLIPMALVCLLTGVHFTKASILMIYFLLCLFVFSLGLGMLLASAMVFFRDMQFLWNVLNMIWMYLTPIFYPESILPEQMRRVLLCNPLYHFLQNERMCILTGISPEPIVYVQCILIALAMLAAGAAVFRKSQDRFVLYL